MPEQTTTPSLVSAMVVQNQLEIDDLLVAVATFDKQIADYEALKKKRVAPIDEEIKKLEEMKLAYRQAILDFMKKSDEKTLNYPGVGKVNRRKGAAKWVVKDEKKLIEYLYSTHTEQELLDNGVLKVEPKIVKKELNKVLDELARIEDPIPEDAVVQEAAEEILTVTLDKCDDMQKRIRNLKEIVLPDQQAPAPALPEQVYDGLDF